ncbi:GNAT family N-acetyltransferase [Cyanobium gracile UHCC 0139]|uniref:GNAT family N-acetyltransferase n=1 Tax=Cyanobium gracile UHCC 0139 TaxID=3110308 RepID=A0ABU5RNT6_9CYAN|nr:GNAT family N-acetyltransferase [Cyanobium gracile]MEA5389748.1 GNAT family N-acetyltransferase [Cyanobium gracile UHCC 0139]
MSPVIDVLEADFANPAHAAALLALMEVYARDPMGGGQGLSAFTRAHLVDALARRPSAHGILAFAAAEPAGLAICLEGFSTFACRPLLNVHDLVVAARFRRQGVGRRLLQRAELIARRLGCCKLTLEVLEGNGAAQAAYRTAGFRPYQLDPSMGGAQFWEKQLPEEG